MADVGKQIKEGRHVGLDIYDLLIEAPEGPGIGRRPALRETARLSPPEPSASDGLVSSDR